MKLKTPTSRKTAKAASSGPKTSKPRKSKALSPEVLPSDSEMETQHSETQHSKEDEELETDREESEAGEISSEEDPSEAEIASSLPTTVESSEPELAAISPHDPLRRYLEEVRRYPLLEPSEEFALAIKLRDQGDLTAAKALVSANLRLVVKIAYEYRTFYSNLLDLIQEGNIGLMKAVSKFDPTKGARLGYYASWWIRSYILKYLLDNFRLVKVGTTQAQKKLFYHLMRERND